MEHLDGGVAPCDGAKGYPCAGSSFEIAGLIANTQSVMGPYATAFEDTANVRAFPKERPT